MKDFIAAAVQMTTGQNIEANWLKVKKYIKQAAQIGAKLVVLPECCIFFGYDEHSQANKAGHFSVYKLIDNISLLAKEYKIFIVAGTIPILDNNINDKRPYSASLFFDDKGYQIARYNKIHLFDAIVNDKNQGYQESNVYKPGSEIINVDTGFCKIGFAVCYDLRFPELFRIHAMNNVDIIIIPAAFTITTGRSHWITLLKARAIENQCFIVASCQQGRHSDKRESYGHSAIISPWGKILSIKRYGEGVIHTMLTSSLLDKIRSEMPVFKHQRFFVNPKIQKVFNKEI